MDKTKKSDNERPRVLISNLMMLQERERFDKTLREMGYEPVWAEPEQFLDERQCLSLVGDIDGWLAGDDRITRCVLKEALPRLKVISKWGTGLDSIDLQAARELGVVVKNSPGAFADAVAEVALHYMISLSRRLVEIDRAVRQGKWPKWQGCELRGQKLGIIGFGAIGQRIAELASCFGMNVMFHDPRQDQAVVLPTGSEACPAALADLATKSDIVCLACNYTPENHHLVNAEFLSRMKPQAILINVARGALVDEVALIEVLREGRIAGAGLDVFECEPMPPDSPLKSMENVILGSHNANNGRNAVEYVHENTLKNLQAVLDGGQQTAQ